MADRATESPVPAPDTQATPANPVLVEGTRGGIVESAHRGAAAVADARGRPCFQWGDVTRPVYPRSAVKPLQALPLVESGAADRFGLSEVELALACASHNGEPRQVKAVKAWLRRLGLDENDLECGPHVPLDAAAAVALVRDGCKPTRLHNNCSGKHAGFLTLARHLGAPIRGYSRPNHPVQQAVSRTLTEMAEVDAEGVPVAVDGCGAPTLGLPLAGLAAAMARLAAGHDLSPARAAAAERVLEAMGREPAMVAGRGRFCTAVIRASAGGVIVKTGAEGVFTAALPRLGLGLALKIDDGARRASEVAVLALLERLGALDADAAKAVAAWARPAVKNWSGRRVGEVRPAPAWAG